LYTYSGLSSSLGRILVVPAGGRRIAPPPAPPRRQRLPCDAHPVSRGAGAPRRTRPGRGIDGRGRRSRRRRCHHPICGGSGGSGAMLFGSRGVCGRKLRR
jgi:hypothetical protein